MDRAKRSDKSFQAPGKANTYNSDVPENNNNNRPENTVTFNAPQMSQEERLRNMVAAQMADLSNERRDWIRTSQIERHRPADSRTLEENRRANVKGTAEARWAQQSSAQLSEWNNFAYFVNPSLTADDNDGTAGQSHRAALQQSLHQNRPKHEHGHAAAGSGGRGGRAGGRARGGGAAGRPSSRPTLLVSNASAISSTGRERASSLGDTYVPPLLSDLRRPKPSRVQHSHAFERMTSLLNNLRSGSSSPQKATGSKAKPKNSPTKPLPVPPRAPVFVPALVGSSAFLQSFKSTPGLGFSPARVQASIDPVGSNEAKNSSVSEDATGTQIVVDQVPDIVVSTSTSASPTGSIKTITAVSANQELAKSDVVEEEIGWESDEESIHSESPDTEKVSEGQGFGEQEDIPHVYDQESHHQSITTLMDGRFSLDTRKSALEEELTGLQQLHEVNEVERDSLHKQMRLLGHEELARELIGFKLLRQVAHIRQQLEQLKLSDQDLPVQVQAHEFPPYDEDIHLVVDAYNEEGRIAASVMAEASARIPSPLSSSNSAAFPRFGSEVQGSVSSTTISDSSALARRYLPVDTDQLSVVTVIEAPFVQETIQSSIDTEIQGQDLVSEVSSIESGDTADLSVEARTAAVIEDSHVQDRDETDDEEALDRRSMPDTAEVSPIIATPAIATSVLGPPIVDASATVSKRAQESDFKELGDEMDVQEPADDHKDSSREPSVINTPSSSTIAPSTTVGSSTETPAGATLVSVPNRFSLAASMHNPTNNQQTRGSDTRGRGRGRGGRRYGPTPAGLAFILKDQEARKNEREDQA